MNRKVSKLEVSESESVGVFRFLEYGSNDAWGNHCDTNHGIGNFYRHLSYT